jgi:hypothetical protein
MGARNRGGTGLSYRPARIHTQPAGTGSLKSILWLLKSVTIRAQRFWTFPQGRLILEERWLREAQDLSHSLEMAPTSPSPSSRVTSYLKKIFFRFELKRNGTHLFGCLSVCFMNLKIYVLFVCFGLIEKPKFVISVQKRNNRNKSFVSDRYETRLVRGVIV